ncbi:helix-turn-helix domain-containing protein [Paenibacillus sp. LMG 31456]|uniref:Helix-turn-helix domain-containing protein n=1 Tax=Paenibacillus foliorum TaxID=2654974 RepID=A0A972GS89_9BACL|nr:helix-turn-helix transcriptional regulator [Paenibacillus foliorum]NOU95921.1 helix-turn-helix domain-containing protein [Paenibacillus foliorum]
MCAADRLDSCFGESPVLDLTFFNQVLNDSGHLFNWHIRLQSSYIGGVERGERNVSLETLEKIIKALNMSFSEFFRFGEIVLSNKLSKEELIEVFSGELLTKEISEVRTIFEIYNIIKSGK